MKAIFLKEWRQAHLLPWAALLFSTMVVALYGLWVTLYAETSQDMIDVGASCPIILLAALPVLVVVSSAGMISAETGAGSIGYLLALPISRSRLWWGKVLAALALTGVCAVALVLPAAIAIPGVRDVLRDTVFYLPDLAVAVLCILSLALFCSTLFARTLTVLLITPALAFTLSLVGTLITRVLGLDVLRYDEGLTDITFWVLLCTPIFLFASWAAFRRGELFESRRHWRVALPLLGLGLALLTTLLWGVARWERRYARSRVADVQSVSFPPGGQTAVVFVQGNPAPVSRDQLSGWRLTAKGEGIRRSAHTLLVDLRTGREVVWENGGEASPVISPDGRRALTVDVIGPRYSNARLRVWEVPSHRCLTDLVFPREKLGRFGSDPSGKVFGPWSPNSKWLSWTSYEVRPESPQEGAEYREKTSLVTMRPDGSDRREIALRDVVCRPGPDHTTTRKQLSAEPLSDWTWAAGEDALYLLSEDGAVYRYTPADGTRSLLWRRAPALPESGRKIWTSHLSLSPDGRRLALRWVTVLTGKGAPTGAVPQSHTVVLSVAGGKARPLTEFAEQPRLDDLRLLDPRLDWSGDSRTLFLDLNRFWCQGLSRPLPTDPLPHFDKHLRTRTLPFGSGVLVGGSAGWILMDGDGRIRGPGQQGSGSAPRTVAPGYEYDGLSTPDGIDAQGRLITHYEPGRLLFALDPQTGARHTIYP